MVIPKRTVEQIEAPLVKVVPQERIWERCERPVHSLSSMFAALLAAAVPLTLERQR